MTPTRTTASFEVGETWYLDLVTGEWSQEKPQQVTGRQWGTVAALSETTITFDTSPPAIANGEVVPGNRRARRAAKARERRGQ